MHLAFRVFDVTTKIRSAEARALGLHDWAALLRHVADKGARVRLLLADFDPLFASELHRASWKSALRLASGEHPAIEILCARHPAQLGPVWRTALWPVGRRLLRKRRAEGLDTPRLREAGEGRWQHYPVTLHQKFAVADGARGVLGGIDLDERRWDDVTHQRAADETWHDVSVSAHGPVCATMEAHFADCWRDASAKGGAAVTAVTPPTVAKSVEPTGAVRFLKTRSEPRPGVFTFGPRTVSNEIEQAHLDAFERAERSIYIETQYFRHKPIAEALARVGEANPTLDLILLLPSEPDRIAFEGDRDLAARHEQSMQLDCLKLCQESFGERMVALSPARPRRADSAEHRPLAGADIVYVHSKVTIIDSDTLIVGSANLNGRSMRWDTEAAVESRNPATIDGLRSRLAQVWLGDGAQDYDRAATWRERALANLAKQPEQRDGFILPYPERRVRRFSLYAPFLPDEMY